ncbi:transposase domain-containing protein [Nonomuraea polychroma]|uniref:transposase domain-containing protein n=1 Tax=Nonomuraea polychroma TaxID=46176 RepID=UPI003D92DDC9
MTLTQTIATAEGVFAPGHLGALTRFVPFELVDAVLDQPGRRERIRSAPLRTGVYFVLALALFPELSYRRVWNAMVGAIAQMGATVARVTGSALTELRQRLGPDPLRETFELVAGPLGRPATPGVFYRGLRTVAFDGCKSTRVPDTRDNVAWLGRHRLAAGTAAAYPLLMVVALVETGTRALLGVVISPFRGEVEAALELIGHLCDGMLVLADRGFDANDFLRAIHGSGAAVVLRVCATRKTPVLQVLHDGSYLSVIAGVAVRSRDGVRRSDLSHGDSRKSPACRVRPHRPRSVTAGTPTCRPGMGREPRPRHRTRPRTSRRATVTRSPIGAPPTPRQGRFSRSKRPVHRPPGVSRRRRFSLSPRAQAFNGESLDDAAKLARR